MSARSETRKGQRFEPAVDMRPGIAINRDSPVGQVRSTRLVDRAPLRVAGRKLGVVDVDGTTINLASTEEAVVRIIADAKRGRGGTVFTLNLDHLVKIRENQAFRLAYEEADYVSADGFPIVMLARWAGADIDRVTGSDMLVPLARGASLAGVDIHLFGTTDPVLQRAGDRLVAEAPGLRIVGREAPPMGFDPTGPAALAAAARIAESGAGICLVALGAPKQELFARTASRVAPNVVFLGIGAGLDFLAGTQRRAPVFLQNAGLEWLWRLAEDPKRLGRRYWRSAAYLIEHLGGHLLRRRGAVARAIGPASEGKAPRN